MAPIQEVDPKNLAEAGWGVIFAPDIGPEVKEAMRPLLEHRRQQAGRYYREISYRSGETKQEFLAKNGAGLGPADPERLPYYLLIVGNPATIPFRFQYELDVQYAVGRIYFEAVEGYAHYARSVVRSETGNIRIPVRRITFFGPQHEHDRATERVVNELLLPLARDLQARTNWEVQTVFAQEANKQRLCSLLGGGEEPGILFAGAQTLVLPLEDPQQLKEQGSIICQDWPGPEAWKGLIPPDHYLSARDLGPTQNLSGMIVLLFGSYTAGTVDLSNEDVLGLVEPRRISPSPFVSGLAQRLLGNAGGGALAVIGYIDRAWTTAFSWSGKSQIETFASTLRRLLSGYPVGFALEFLNQKYAELAVEANALFQDREMGESPGREVFSRTLRAAGDAHSIIALGDPAVRVPLAGSPLKTADAFASGNLVGAINDQAAERDQLGFKDYAEAFADLIQSVETRLPLTIGIFGSWGVGKTTLMELITRKLRESPRSHGSGDPENKPAISKVHIITFSAWEYSAREAIWPGLVRKIMDGLEKEISWRFPGRFLTKLGWNLRSALRKERGRIFLIACILVASIAAVVTLLVGGQLDHRDMWKPLIAAGLTGLAGILGGGLKILGDTLSRPMGQWLTSALQEDAYGRPIAHFTRIREDLEFLDKRLGADKMRPERALIVIDDLDRCEPGKAVEMLQAIKLLLDFKSFVVCLGIDARIITRAVEKHYKELLGESGASGYEYLDKIVQIPFRIPVPERKELEEFLSEQMGNPQPPRSDEEAPSEEAVADAASAAGGGGDGKGPEMERSEPPQAQPLVVSQPRTTPSAFTHVEHEAFQRMIDFLRPNPRHIKRLLNVYRLVRTLADFRGEQILLDKPGATICWVVLCAQWPYMTYLMLRRFQEVVRRADEETDFQFPSENPLTWLLAKIEKEIDPAVRKRLDQDPEMLGRLIAECSEARISWQELRVIRRYTINFNPAIELEAMAEAPPRQPAKPPRKRSQTPRKTKAAQSRESNSGEPGSESA